MKVENLLLAMDGVGPGWPYLEEVLSGEKTALTLCEGCASNARHLVGDPRKPLKGVDLLEISLFCPVCRESCTRFVTGEQFLALNHAVASWQDLMMIGLDDVCEYLIKDGIGPGPIIPPANPGHGAGI